MEEEKVPQNIKTPKAEKGRKAWRSNSISNFSYISYDLESVFIHTSSNQSRNQDANMIDENSNSSAIDKNQGIVDIKAITNKLTWEEIASIIIDELGANSNSNLREFNREGRRQDTTVRLWEELQNIGNIKANFSDRVRYHKLTPSQMKYVVKELQEQSFNAKKVSKELYLSPSLLYKIIAMNNDEYERRIMQTPNITYGLEKQTIIQCITNFDQNRSTPNNVKDVQSYVYHKIGKFYSYKIVREIMKKDVHLTFKRCKPRPNSVNLKKLALWRILYWVKFIKNIDNETLIANVDESTISRHSQIFYSCSRRGQSREFKCMPFTGSINLILTILSNGSWFCLIINQKMNSERFLKYMQKFTEWISSKAYFGYRKLIIMMDNWAIHRNKKNLAIMSQPDHQVMFIPP